MDMNKVLDLPLDAENDAGAKTVREYLSALLLKLWREGHCFDSKRPFGNSDWFYDLFDPLVKAGLVKGKLDSDGCVQEMDTKKAYLLIEKAIVSLTSPVPAASRKTGESK